jgi:hypothetical protein
MDENTSVDNKEATVNTTNQHTLEYDSNPFTLSFKGLGLLVDYARGVFIALLVLGLFGLISNIFNILPNPFPDSSTSSTAEPFSSSVNSNVVLAIGLFIVVALIVGFFVGILFSAAYKGFVAAGTLSAVNKQTITFGEALNEMSQRFTTLFKAELITTLRIIGGYLLLVVPGIRAQLRYQSTPYILMANKQMSASEAIAKSKELYRNHLMEVFGILTVGALIPFIGQAISASGMAMSTVQVSTYAENNKPTPKTHFLNYIGLIFGVFLLFIIIVIAGAFIYAFAR